MKKSRQTFTAYILVILILVFSENCRVGEDPEGNPLDPATPSGLILTNQVFEIFRAGLQRNWVSFSITNIPGGFNRSFDRTSSGIFKLSSDNANTFLSFASDGINFSQQGNRFSSSSVNLFSVFASRIQTTNFNSVDNGSSWTTNTSFPLGFCMVRDSNTSAYVLASNFVQRTTDSGATFTTITSSPGYPTRTSGLCMYANGRIYLLGGNSNVVSFLTDFWESPDGINWTKISDSIISSTGNSGFNRQCDFLGQNYIGIAYNTQTPEKFYAISSNLALLTSVDGITWNCENPSVNGSNNFGIFLSTSNFTNTMQFLGNRLFVYSTGSSSSSSYYTDF